VRYWRTSDPEEHEDDDEDIPRNAEYDDEDDHEADDADEYDDGEDDEKTYAALVNGTIFRLPACFGGRIAQNFSASAFGTPLW
jgi:hypothetical protein